MAIDMDTMLAKIKDRQWALADIDWDAPGAETISDEFRPKLKAFMADLCWIENIGAFYWPRYDLFAHWHMGTALISWATVVAFPIRTRIRAVPCRYKNPDDTCGRDFEGDCPK